MDNLDQEYYRKNAQLLLKGLWYSELPDILEIDDLCLSVESILSKMDQHSLAIYEQDGDGFIQGWKGINSPKGVRSPGVEALSFFEFKKNKSLREMQIPNLVHYLSFIYNSLHVFSPLFEKLYIDSANAPVVAHSNSYLVFENEFVADVSYEGDAEYRLQGLFATRNNKTNTSAMFSENRVRQMNEERAYLYSMKVDIESFFPSLYTHYFERMAKKEPYKSLISDSRYFSFLDRYHQRINDNQTKGVPAGVFSSHVGAELLMLCVDQEIEEYIQSREAGIGYIRYVDDLTFYSDDEAELKLMFSKVQSILNAYRLRINGNKTESIHSVMSVQPSYIREIERLFPFLADSDQAHELEMNEFLEIRKYIGNCLESSRTSQIKTLLSRIRRFIEENELDIGEIDYLMFCYLLRLAFEEPLLCIHIFRLLNALLAVSESKAQMINELLAKQQIIDSQYADTVFQIWFYYTLFQHADTKTKRMLLKGLNGKDYNPLVASTMVLPGKKANETLYKYIRDSYIRISGSSEWKKEIMYSKWWLPLFKIIRYDSHNYDSFLHSENIPVVFLLFSVHET